MQFFIMGMSACLLSFLLFMLCTFWTDFLSNVKFDKSLTAMSKGIGYRTEYPCLVHGSEHVREVATPEI